MRKGDGGEAKKGGANPRSEPLAAAAFRSARIFASCSLSWTTWRSMAPMHHSAIGTSIPVELQTGKPCGTTLLSSQSVPVKWQLKSLRLGPDDRRNSFAGGRPPTIAVAFAACCARTAGSLRQNEMMMGACEGLGV